MKSHYHYKNVIYIPNLPMIGSTTNWSCYVSVTEIWETRCGKTSTLLKIFSQI